MVNASEPVNNEKIKEVKKAKNKHERSFYVALIICLMAISVAIYSSYSNIKNFVSTGDENQSSIGSTNDIIPKTHNQIINENENEDANFKNVKKYKDLTQNTNSQNDQGSIINNFSEEAALPTEGKVSGAIVLPAGKKIIKKYSGENPVYSKTFNDWRIHNGIDFELPNGSKISAITNGKVKDIYSDPIYGTTIVIDHDKNFTAIYSGLLKTTMVNVGDNVECGTEIGAIGKIPCESSDGEHLHLSVKKGDTYIDPLEILGKIE